MSSASLALQTAVQGVLDTALSVPVYDHVPQDEMPPFVSIGEDSATNDDTKTRNGSEHLVEVNVYSSNRGLDEVKTIMAAVYAALQNVPLSVSGFNSSPPIFAFSTTFLEPDGARGVIRFTVRTEPE